MTTKPLFFLAALGMVAPLMPQPLLISATAQTPTGDKSLVLLPINADSVALLKPNTDQVTFALAPNGLDVTIAPGDAGYPGFNLAPTGGNWDLSEFGHVAATVTNTGAKNLNLLMRVDNAGRWQDEPWNTEPTNIKPGETKTFKVIFGHSYDFKPAYALDPSKVINIQLFSGKSNEARSYRLESLVAAGPKGEKPPINPASIRIKPTNGFLLGGGATVDATTQFAGRGAKTSLGENGVMRVELEAKSKDGNGTIKPPQGRWDLREFLEVRAVVKNEGTAPVTPRIRLDSNGGASRWFAASAPLAPGAQIELVAPFDNGAPVDIGLKEKINRVASNVVSGVNVGTVETEGERIVSVSSVRALMPPAPKLPTWLGKRPPIEGAWKQTFTEEFNGKELDLTKWSPYSANFWDKVSAFSKNNVLVGDGVAKLRLERKRSKHNDEPEGKEQPYTTGFLETYDLWAQKYGYFEARMKLPKAPGMWPAFWMMPDRGRNLPAGPEKWRRQDTNPTGMEFDIMEFLSGWGPNRFTIAQHWDGYQKDHKSNGAGSVYLQPDAQGFITVGLLWTPGETVYYGNGKELARWKDPRVSDVPSHIMFTNVTGGWDNLPLDNKQLPDDFVIDYVRAWQRDDLK